MTTTYRALGNQVLTSEGALISSEGARAMLADILRAAVTEVGNPLSFARRLASAHQLGAAIRDAESIR